MHIPPQRRRRALRVHFLNIRGRSQRQPAAQLEISRATVRSDLQLVETHWSSLAAPAADDLLLDSLQLLQNRLALAIEHDHVAILAERLTPAEYLRARDARETQLTALIREIRRTAHDIHCRAAQRADQPDLYSEFLPESAESAPKSSNADHPQSTISSPAQEIVRSEAPEEKNPPELIQSAPDDPQDAIIRDALAAFPHLKGRPNEQILAFLEQFTDPTREPDPIPYAEAAA